MKKVLLVGELNQIMGSLHKYLSKKFEIQMCVDHIEVVKNMTKLFRPDMVVLCLIGVGELDNKISDYFMKEYSYMPVLLVGTEEECNYYGKLYELSQFDYITRPTSVGMLQQKCDEMLEVTEVEEKEEEIKTQEVKAGERKHILAVDDSGILLRSVKAMLENYYEVSVANSGMTAMKQAKKKKPDLILLDYEMPEWDGRKTLEEIRNDDDLKDVPVVFLTAVADKEHITAVLSLRPSGYLLKPIETEVLLDTIERAMVKI